MEEWDNQERRRYYGKRRGDIIRSSMYRIERAEVTGYYMDNNRIRVRVEGETKDCDLVAEWCQIVTKVEDRTDIKK
jgi:endo-alpha-1,4-polygalactosaminidase (GH114 family)